MTPLIRLVAILTSLPTRFLGAPDHLLLPYYYRERFDLIRDFFSGPRRPALGTNCCFTFADRFCTIFLLWPRLGPVMFAGLPPASARRYPACPLLTSLSPTTNSPRASSWKARCCRPAIRCCRRKAASSWCGFAVR